MSTRSERDPDGGLFYYEVDDGRPPSDLLDDVLRPRDQRDDDVDPESVRGNVLALYDAMDAARTSVREAMETEWYNGNMTDATYDRLDRMVAKMVANPPEREAPTHE